MVDMNLIGKLSTSDDIGIFEMNNKKVCKECGNELCILGRHVHPILGKKYIICGKCFLKLDKIIEQWRNFVITNPDIINSININGEKLKNNFENTVISIMRTYGYKINDDYLFGYQKNILEHTIINDNKQELNQFFQ